MYCMLGMLAGTQRQRRSFQRSNNWRRNNYVRSYLINLQFVSAAEMKQQDKTASSSWVARSIPDRTFKSTVTLCCHEEAGYLIVPPDGKPSKIAAIVLPPKSKMPDWMATTLYRFLSFSLPVPGACRGARKHWETQGRHRAAGWDSWKYDWGRRHIACPARWTLSWRHSPCWWGPRSRPLGGFPGSPRRKNLAPRKFGRTPGITLTVSRRRRGGATWWEQAKRN